MISPTLRARSKADPALKHLMSFPEEQLRRIYQKERQTFQAKARQVAQLRAELNAPALPEARQAALKAELQQLKARYGAPLTCALHFPDLEPQAARRPFQEPWASVLIRTRMPQRDLHALGVKPRTQAGDIHTADVPWRLLPALIAHDQVAFVEYANAWMPDLTESCAFAEITTLQAEPLPLTGKDVVVGVIDGFLDFYHMDFRNKNEQSEEDDNLDYLETTRILYYWDQTLVPVGNGEASPPADPELPGFYYQNGTGYGVEYDAEDINRQLEAYVPGEYAYSIVRTVPEKESHGTLVTSCAAGNGNGSGLVGAAPAADIIFVNLLGESDTQGQYLNIDKASYLDGFSYIFARAAQLGKPCVVNLSGSDNMGPHDGTTLGEQYLDNLLETPGRAIVCSSGNTGDEGVTHVGTMHMGETYTCTVEFDLGCHEIQIFEIWMDGQDTAEVTLDFPYERLKRTTLKIAPGESDSITIVNEDEPVETNAGSMTVTLSSTLGDGRNGDNVISLIIALEGKMDIPFGDWIFSLVPIQCVHGQIHAWGERNNMKKFRWTQPSTAYSVAVPGTALRVLTVGSHSEETDPAATPLIDSFSGQGPTRDRRRKPEVVACGDNVTGAASRTMNSNDPGYLTMTMDGTSFSAPLVAGICALMFEHHGPQLTFHDLKQMIAGAAHPANDAQAFGYGWVKAATLPGASPADDDPWIRDSVNDTGREPSILEKFWLSPDIILLDAQMAPASEVIYDEQDIHANFLEVTVRNRGSQPARNLKVSLFWHCTTETEQGGWQSTHIHANPDDPMSDDPNTYGRGTNAVVVQELAASGETQVRFAWNPPNPQVYLVGAIMVAAVVTTETSVSAEEVVQHLPRYENDKAVKVFSMLD